MPGRFRSINFGGSCGRITQLEHAYSGADHSAPINLSGRTSRIANMFGARVKVIYHCRSGKLTGGSYLWIPDNIVERVLAGLKSKFGDPKIEDNPLGLEPTRVWELEPGQTIVLTPLQGWNLHYKDEGLLKVLERNEALRAAVSGDL